LGIVVVSVIRLVLGGSVLSAVLSAHLCAADLAHAEDLYKHTDFEASLSALDKHSADPATNFLISRNYFALGEYKHAVEYLQKVTQSQPTNSEAWDWLGRAYGRRAETSNPLLAPGFASKARDAFLKSVAYDGHNKDALADLFDYYLEAPGFLGGGYDKALDIAERTAKIDPAEAYFEQAKLAQKRKQYESAETQLRKAVAVAPHEIGHLISLARFLATQGRLHESDAIFEQAKQVAPDSPGLWFARADVLIRNKRNLGEAKELLQKYVKASVTVDDPPKTEARRLLKQVGGA
jgi:tetratricopeptide (TPR) repeat protein